MLHPHFHLIGRKHKNIFDASRIIILLFVFIVSLTAQNFTNPNFPDAYKNFYIWKEKENTFPTDDSVLTVLGRWAWGPCLAVDADSSFAYIGNGPTFHVLDISNPSKPEIVGEYLTEGYISDIEIRDNAAFLCIGRWFLILDISDPFNPTKISDLIIATNDAAISFALDGSFAYVTTFGGAMWVVDISDLNNPFKRDVIAAGGQLAYCVEAKDNYVYIGNPEWPPMVIVDATNPDSLTRVDFEMGGWGYSAYIKDTLLFLGVHGYSGRQFKIYNVTNAASPEFVGQLEIPNLEDVMAITISEDRHTAFIRTTSGSVYSVDISDLTQPEITDEYERPIAPALGNTGIAFQNNSIFSAHYNGLLTLNASHPDSLILQSFYPTGGTALEMDSKDSLVFVACGLSGMWILDCSNPQEVKNISNVITCGLTVNILVDDTLAYIYNWKQDSESDTTIGLWIINISIPNQPEIITHYVPRVTSSPPHSMTKSNNFIFITQTADLGNDTILEIIDVSNAFNPKFISVLTGNSDPHNITVKDSVLYLATSDRGLRIINISDIYNPYESNVFQDSTFLVGIAVKNNLGFADRIDTLFVLDITNPINPFVIGKMGRNYGGFGTIHIEISKNYLYWAEGTLGVVDISDSTAPKELTRFISPAYFGYDVELSEDVILFSDRPVGIWLLKNNLITDVKGSYLNSLKDFELLQNYPNPFNPTTKIEFNISKRGKVLIEVYDVLGQQVKVLLNEEVEKGKHKIEFDAKNLSSGIYFYRLSTGRNSTTKKMVIIR
jgi:hypothetical protein